MEYSPHDGLIMKQSKEVSPGDVLIGLLSFYNDYGKNILRPKSYTKLKEDSNLNTVDLNTSELEELMNFAKSESLSARYGLKSKLDKAVKTLETRLKLNKTVL